MDKLLPLGLAFIMFAIGLGLKPADFSRVFRQPRAMVAGLVNQLVLLPLLGAAVIAGYSGRPDFALGIMILAASPGGITSNLLTTLAGGNAALSVSMTALTSLASVVSVPLILDLSQRHLLGSSHPVAMPVGMIMGSILVVTALPIVVGMGLQKWKTRWADWLRPKARQMATIVFAMIVASAFVGQMDNIVGNFLDIGPRLMVLNVATMALGFYSARALKLDGPDAIAISLECGLQNAALAIFVAVSVLGNPVLVVPAITYALVMNITAGAFIFWARRPRLSAVQD
ncbi:MAG: bile acid:sodium symporter family protein [Alphaproteobacteria bacterium]|nr:bile acid:sodium symporter family protein [Alphaproteobacteria bacterium]MBF0250085.1 bile acid:sodium symporter family protein [Alphaproteobacteria bacterium]